MDIATLRAVYTADTSNFEAGTRRVRSEFDQTESKARSGGSAISGFWSVLGGNLASAAISTLVSGLSSASAAVFTFTARLEQTKIAFTTLLGSAQLATAHLQELQKFAAQTPFEFEALTKASQRFQNMGINAKEIIPIMTAVGDAVAAVGGSSETIDRVTLAISQMSAKGKVSAEEINQLAEAGIGGWRILAEQLGKTQGEVIKLAEQGKISSDIFIKAFKQFSEQNFGGAMEKQSHTFQGAMSTIKDTLLTTASTAFEPLYKKISEITDRVAIAVQKTQNLGEQLSTIIRGLGEVVGEAAASLGATVGKRFSDAFSDAAEGNLSKSAEKIYSTLFPLQALINEFGKGLVGGLFGFETEEKRQAALQKTTRELLEVIKAEKARTQEVDKGKLALDALKTSTENAAKVQEKLKDITLDAGRAIFDFSNDSRELAVRQKLLAEGISDVSSGLAAQAIELARISDAWDAYFKNVEKASSDKLDLTRTWRNQVTGLANTIKDLQFGFDFPLLSGTVAGQLDRLSRTIREMRATFSNLQPEQFVSGEYAKLESQLKSLEDAYAKLTKSHTKFLSSLRDEKIGSLQKGFQGIAKDFREQIEELSPSFDEFDKAGRQISAFFTNFVRDNKLGSEQLTSFNIKMKELIDLSKQGLEFGTFFGAATGLARQALEGFGLTGSELHIMADELVKILVSVRKLKEENALKTAGEEAVKQFQLLKESLDDIEESFNAIQKKAFESSFKGKFAAFAASVPSFGATLKDGFFAAINGIGDVFANAIARWDGTFKGFFKSIAQGFAGLIQQILAELIKLLVVKAILSIFSGLLGGFGGGGFSGGGFGLAALGGAGPAGRAGGGEIYAGNPYFVHADEMIIPATNGRVLTRQEAQGYGGGTINIVQNFKDSAQLTPRRSRRQIAEQTASALNQRVGRRFAN